MMFWRSTCILVALLFRWNAVNCSSSTITSCAHFELIGSSSGDFTLSADVWNAARLGGQCITLHRGDTAFSATWNWADDMDDVHSFPHVQFHSADLPLALSSIASLIVKGTWSALPASSKSYASLDDVGAKFNVAIDMFVDPDPIRAQNETTAQYEIMVWVGREGNPAPLGYSGHSSLLTQKVGNTSFSLYSGTNQRNHTTFTWISSKNINAFSIDVTYLIQALFQNDMIPAGSLLGLVEFGTEAFFATENITFTAKDFAMDLVVAQGTPAPTLPVAKAQGASLSSGIRGLVCWWLSIWVGLV